MKRRTQKIFITLLSLFIAGFAMVNAYTFEVLNWNPFGVLNLKTLIMKPDVNTTGIVIDGASYTIKIDPNHESEDGGIWVDRICDENGENCKGVSELLEGLGELSAITIEGEPENVCFKKDDKTLACNNEFLRSLIESWGLGGSMNIDGRDQQYCYRLKDRNTLYCDNTNLPTGNGNTPGNGKITIIQGSNERIFNLNDSGDQKITLSNGGGTTSGAIAYGSGEYICVKNGNNLDCSKAKLGELKPDKRCTFDGTSINCSETKPSGGSGGTTYTAGTAIEITNDVISVKPNARLQPGYVTAPTQKGKCWKTDPITGQPLRGDCGGGGDGITLITGQNNKYCKYIESSDGKGGTTKGINCTYDAGSSTPTGSGDSLWKTGTSVSVGTLSYNIGNHIRPLNDNYNLYFSDNTTIYHGGTLKFGKAGFNLASSPIQFDAKGARFGYMNDTAFSGAGVGINGGMLVIGNNASSSYNKIMIFASGTTSTNTSNYEILGNKSLLVGSYNHGYIYFAGNGSEKGVGINTQNVTNAALTVNGGVKIGYGCISKTCSGGNVGTIVYYETKDAYNNNLGHYAGCKSYGTQNGRQTYAWVELDFGNGSIISGTTLPTPTCNAIMPINSSTYQTEMAMQGLLQN